MTLRFANAPVTWGIWGPHSLPQGRTPRDILSAVVAAGYTGCELGPPDLFGDSPEAIADLFAEYGLACAGAYVPLRPLDGPEVLAGDLDGLRRVAAILSAFDAPGPLILAEETYPEIKRALRRGAAHPELDLSPADWRTLIAGIEEGGRIGAGMGLTLSYHPHTGTHIEQPHEVDRFLADTDLPVTLDTGHAVAGGDEMAALWPRMGARTNHVHIKDVHMAPVLEAAASGTEFGIAAAAAPLGGGDLDLDPFLSDLLAAGYAGWLVVEQDRRPDGGHEHSAVDAEQKQNLDWLHAHLNRARTATPL